MKKCAITLLGLLAACFLKGPFQNACAQRPSASSADDVVGVWKEYVTVDGKDVDRAYIKLSQESDGSLRAMFVDLRPSALFGADLRGIRYADGRLRYRFPDWGGGQMTFEGRLSTDGALIKEVTGSPQRSICWSRVADEDTLTLVKGLEGSLRPPRDSEYVYRVPPQTGDGWSTSPLRAHGLDEEVIARMGSAIRRGEYGDIHSLLIVKDDQLVLEEYFRANGRLYGDPVTSFYRSRRHLLASATKSITSALVGIAIAKGYVEGVSVSVFDLLAEYDHLATVQKKGILLEHLLTMSGGLQWRQSGGGPSDVEGMWQTEDVVGYYLKKPVEDKPGARFCYSNGASSVLGAIVSKVSGVETDVFAEKHLFAPLGIDDVDWWRYPDGTLDTDGSLSLRARDLAKIGLLYLKRGVWNGQQIVPRQWVEDSTKRHILGTEMMWYGYQWWHRDFDVEGRTLPAYFAWGSGGQYAVVFPDVELVVVSNAGNFDYVAERRFFEMIDSYILPALFSSTKDD